ncbi:trypsin-like peptidase domain-containing protein [Modestobacter sp. NPDC049651]|uniref:S1C family serine protease n=1 Tax=unclassified Modestobacter TaxID=2643866 RepID=UPI0033C5337B
MTEQNGTGSTGTPGTPGTPQQPPAGGGQPGWAAGTPAQPGWTGGQHPAGDTGRQPTERFGVPPYGAPHQPAGYGAPHQGWTGQPAGWSTPQGQAGQPGQPGQVPPLFQAPAQPADKARRSGRWRIGVAGLVAGALIGGGAGAAVAGLDGDGTVVASGATSAQNVVIKDPQSATTATAAAAKAAPSVVTIYVTASGGSGSGSGVVLSKDGYVLTNNHVVTLDSATSQATVQVRTTDGTLYDATVVGTDPTSDLAVIKLSDARDLTPATFADSEKVQVGDTAVAIGAPLGLSNTVTDGIISATNRAVQTGSTQNDSTVIDAIQTDAAINPGNSGGPLVNSAGEVIGINSAIATVASGSPGGQDAQSGNIGVGFAIPSNAAKRIAQQIVDTGKATHALLGVSAQTATANGNSEVGTGATIAQVTDGSPAADAGLRPGDVIIAVGDRQVTTSTELTAAVRSEDPGDKVTLTVRRGNDTTKVDVTLDEAD